MMMPTRRRTPVGQTPVYDRQAPRLVPKHNLPDSKDEVDNQFGIAGGTDLSYAMGPYMNALESSTSEPNILTLSQFLDRRWFDAVG
jgi:hypothetical protein